MDKQISNTETPMNLEPIGKRYNNKSLMTKVIKYRYFYIMSLPALVMLTIFHYIPMFGIKIAFYDYGIFGPIDFVGMENFKRIFATPKFLIAFSNTIQLSLVNLGLGIVCALGFALLLNEVVSTTYKRITQTVLYLPHFLSWVVVASIFTMVLSPSSGLINGVIQHFGGKPIYFLVSEKWWRPIFFFISRWKDTGWGTIIYLAALTGIDPQLYEAAAIDGSGRLKQVWYITLPALQNTILVVLVMDLAKVLNIFESVFVLINPMVYGVADVIGTYTYRVGLINADYGYSTAVGLFKSVISMVLVLTANHLSKKIKGEGIL